MRRIGLGLTVILALLSTQALAQQPPASAPQLPERYVARVLSSDEAQADVALLRRALETIHPGLYRRTPKDGIESAFQKLESATAGPVSETALYREISLMLAQIRCNHTKAEQSDQLWKWRVDRPSHLPFRFRLIQGRMIVVSSDPAQPGLKRGAEILSINGAPVAKLAKALGEFMPIDGDTVWSRDVDLANDSDLMGSGFDHFYPYVFGFADRYVLSLRDSDAAPIRRVELKPVTFRAWVKIDNDGAAYSENFADTTTWRMLDNGIGYVRVATFVNYRKPADAQALFAKIFNELREKGAKRVIVDLRDNGGGSNDASLALLDHLALRAYTYQRATRLKAIRYGDLPNYIQTWGERDALFQPPESKFTKSKDGWWDRLPSEDPDVLLERQPAKSAFTGPVTVLTGPANGSGATMVIAKLKDEGRVRLVGGRSGGSGDGPTAGQIFNVKLPNSGIVVRVPIAFNQMAVTNFEPGGGVTPDVEVEQSVEDFRAGRDTVLEAAVKDLGP
jgi:hypothetical protein